MRSMWISILSSMLCGLVWIFRCMHLLINWIHFHLNRLILFWGRSSLHGIKSAICTLKFIWAVKMWIFIGFSSDLMWQGPEGSTTSINMRVFFVHFTHAYAAQISDTMVYLVKVVWFYIHFVLMCALECDFSRSVSHSFLQRTFNIIEVRWWLTDFLVEFPFQYLLFS